MKIVDLLQNHLKMGTRQLADSVNLEFQKLRAYLHLLGFACSYFVARSVHLLSLTVAAWLTIDQTRHVIVT